MTAHRQKPCKDCGAVLTLRNFYKHPSYADGHMNSCRRCHIANVTANRELKEEHYRALKQRIASRQKYREQRAAYARSERGQQVHRAACRLYHSFKRLEARA
jgi:nitrate/TMAO reductase-like tetraheme cytochrome c subunit